MSSSFSRRLFRAVEPFHLGFQQSFYNSRCHLDFFALEFRFPSCATGTNHNPAPIEPFVPFKHPAPRKDAHAAYRRRKFRSVLANFWMHRHVCGSRNPSLAESSSAIQQMFQRGFFLHRPDGFLRRPFPIVADRPAAPASWAACDTRQHAASDICPALINKKHVHGFKRLLRRPQPRRCRSTTFGSCVMYQRALSRPLSRLSTLATSHHPRSFSLLSRHAGHRTPSKLISARRCCPHVRQATCRIL